MATRLYPNTNDDFLLELLAEVPEGTARKLTMVEVSYPYDQVSQERYPSDDVFKAEATGDSSQLRSYFLRDT
ncbi:MAG: hypothetical protein U9Q82_11200 [Chloroflexota bacterium]|nr:hypothetical protein [Chloroflexota bacterium]